MAGEDGGQGDQGVAPALGQPSIAGYEVLRELGRGGMGVVWLARQDSLGRLVALKVLRGQLEADPELVARFSREARSVAGLTHPSIVPVHDFGHEDGVLWLTMPYLSGGSLADRIRQRGALGPAEVTQIGRPLAGALSCAHEHGIVHRDVKPANVLFDEADNAYLADFGIASIGEKTALTRTDSILGTTAYMAPELATGGDPSPLTDIYALGATLYEALAGRPPFVGSDSAVVLYQHRFEPVPPLPDDVPAPLRTAVVRALDKDPARRFSSATDFADGLDGVGQARSIDSPQPAVVDSAVVDAHDQSTAAPNDDETRVHRRFVSGPDQSESPPTDARVGQTWTRVVLLAVGAVLALVASGVVAAVLARDGGSTSVSAGGTRTNVVAPVTSLAQTDPSKVSPLSTTPTSTNVVPIPGPPTTRPIDPPKKVDPPTERIVDPTDPSPGNPIVTPPIPPPPPQPPPGAPSNITAENVGHACVAVEGVVCSTTLRVSWTDNSDNESGFEISNGEVSRSVPANVTEYLWSDLPPQTYMCVKVRSFNDQRSSWVPSVSPYYVCATTQR